MNVQTIDQPDAAACLLQPPRSEILRALRQPGSAASVARELGLPRQRVTYHVRQLEKHGLLDHVEDRRVGNCMERVVRARAARFMISPRVLGELGLDRDALADRFSSAYLVASASHAADAVARQRVAAESEQKKLATLTIESQVAFASPREQAAFADELRGLITDLVKRYDSADNDARPFDLRVFSFPTEDPDEQDP